jgi:2-(1,2-epoxy-1,2-dihydrophenyl)acetyl-CoA isomerase
MPPAYQHLRIETTAEGVRIVTLNRPEKLNAVNAVLENELPQAVNEASADAPVRCVLITGAGRGFCAGLELDPANIGRVRDPQTRGQKLDDLGWVGRWALSLANCEAPVIAAINGPAAGAGFALALAADIRLISDSAVVTCGYARIGLSPDAGMSYFLPRLVGLGRATEMLLSARDIGAEEAVATGIAAARYPAADFATSALAYATRIAQGPTCALALTKRLLLQSFDNDLATQLRAEYASIKQCFTTADVPNAIQAFREKRKPVFQGN